MKTNWQRRRKRWSNIAEFSLHLKGVSVEIDRLPSRFSVKILSECRVWGSGKEEGFSRDALNSLVGIL